MAKEIERIAKMLGDESAEKQHAAAVVLGELKSKAPEVYAGLSGLLRSEIPALEAAGARALQKIGAKKALKDLFPLLTARDRDVRQAAGEAIISCGEAVVGQIKKRYEDASADERMRLDTILAELGGKDAYGTLLDGLLLEPDHAHDAALKARHHLKDASATERRSYRSQIEKFIKRKDVQGQPHSLAAALKILAYLEDTKTLPTLLEYSVDESRDAEVRQEAVIGLRFALQKNAQVDDVVKGLITVSGTEDRGLARTALDTLGLLNIPDKHLDKFAALTTHKDLGRASFVIQVLGRTEGAKAAKALVKSLVGGNLRRGEMCAEALEGRTEAVPDLVKAILDTDDAEKALLMSKVLKPMHAELKPAQRKKLVEGMATKLKDGEHGWEAILQVTREADAKATAEALRDLAAKLRKSKKVEKAVSVLTLLTRTDGATDDDRYKLASLELGRSRQDTNHTARGRDPALKHLKDLADNGFDVFTALKKDRALENKDLFYVGFHFCELAYGLGEEVLEEVVKKGGRTKIAKMAKNKLKLVQED
jgi:HEAT repeat protein